MPELSPPSERSGLLAVRTFVMTFLFLTVWAYIALSVRFFDRYLGVGLPEWLQLPGMILMIAGFATGMTSVFTFFIAGKGTPAPLDPPKQFVVVGPYHYTRNPMYLGGWVMIVGLALYQSSFAVLLFSFLWVGVVHGLVLTLEEPGLRKKFGRSYEEYCERVPRWFLRFGS